MLSENFTIRLNKAIKEQNLRQVDLIKKTKEVMKKYIKDYNGDGIDKTLLNKYIKGVAIAKQDNIFILAKALNVSEAWLMGYDTASENQWININENSLNIDNASCITSNDSTIKIPILGKVPAGVPIEAIENIIGYEDISLKLTKGGNQFFALKIDGDSMYPDYHKDDIIIIRQQPDCNSGDDCVVMVNGDDATFKRVIKQDKSIILKPLNNSYEPYFFDEYDILTKPVKIIGVAIEVRRKLRK